MIRAIYVRDGDSHELTVTGHSGYAEHGQDIVCAGVSAITLALLGWIDDNSQNVSSMDGSAVHDGHLWMKCTGNKRVTTAFQMAVKGLEQLASAYPSHVEFQYSCTDR